ncbi:cytidine deaminase [Flavobacteriaceae bacterium F08102]|nr:cytidine deaminase [Flavobacteriaceae bacterium F08102]
MKKQQHTTTYTVYENMEELPPSIKVLMEVATQSREKAYAPYSNFLVGAAVLLENEEIVIGNNQENAAYPSGLCAERVAIYSAGAQFPSIDINAIAIAARSRLKEVVTPVGPCGSCRQAIAEYEQKQGHPISIYFMGNTGNIINVDSLSTLLPFGFDANQL